MGCRALNKLFKAVSPLCLTWNDVYIYKARKDLTTYGAVRVFVCGYCDRCTTHYVMDHAVM